MKNVGVDFTPKCFSASFAFASIAARSSLSSKQFFMSSILIPLSLAIPEMASKGAACGLPAPLAGNVFKVPVSQGQSVDAGDVVIILEAMKMEHALLAPQDCVIDEVLVRIQDQVEAAANLVRLSPAEEQI